MKKKRFTRVSQVISAISLAAITLPTMWAWNPPAHAREAVISDYVVVPCPMPVPEGFVEGEDITCGYVTVPEDYGVSVHKNIQLAIAILHSSNPHSDPDPLIMVQGGPGTSALDTFVWLMASQFGASFLQQRDIILIEQRGNYYSKPNLYCSGDETSTACRDRLIAEGVNLQAYNIHNNAADVAKVMEVLGHDQYNLYGVSFGTMLVQYVMRDYPERLRSVILDSVLPITYDRSVHGDFSTFSTSSKLLALHQLFADCAADPVCNKRYPNLERNFYDTIVRLNNEPAVLSFVNPETGEPFEVTLTGDRLLGMLIQALYGNLGPQIPILMDLIDAGEYDLVFEPEMFMEGGESTWSAGLHYTMNCSVLPELSDVDLVAHGLDALVVQLQNNAAGFNTICSEWGIENADFYTISPVASNIPTLLLSGMLDPNTPPRNAEIVAENLDNGVTISFPGLGHEVIYRHVCPMSISLAFIADPAVPPDTTCVQDMQSRFASEPITARLLALQKDPPFIRLAVLLGSVLLMLSGVVVWTITGLQARRRGNEPVKKSLRARWLAGAAAVLNITFLIIFIASNPMEITYGYPLVLRLGMLLPLFSLAPAVAALVHAISVWKRNFWSVVGRVHYTLVVVAVAAFVWQLDYWYLLGWRLGG